MYSRDETAGVIQSFGNFLHCCNRMKAKLMKSNRYVIVAVVVTAFFVVWFCFGFLPNGNEEKAISQHKTGVRFEKRHLAEPIKVASDFDWSDLTEVELDDMLRYFQEDREKKGFEWKTIAFPGETVVTEMFEGRNGQFIISEITPTVSTNVEGIPVVLVKINMFELSLSGEITPVINTDREITSKGQSRDLIHNERGEFRIAVAAEIILGGSAVDITLQGGFSQIEK